ncbi:DUF2007 domain-containing protein [Malonomonas rubra]|uniref:putative signal transducing protein n=1 Tax=Malonomonas rubra TaxID=57040 RepID=UPI0026F15AB5|nr:DUF2007 domain-containing protein [Malonomonas rubra]
MKKLHTFDLWDGPQAAMYKEMLGNEGIDCLVKNDRLSAAIGEIPFVECYPELWVVDEEVYPRARLLLDAWMANAIEKEGHWVCENCGEESDGQFEVCWNCSQPRE